MSAKTITFDELLILDALVERVEKLRGLSFDKPDRSLLRLRLCSAPQRLSALKRHERATAMHERQNGLITELVTRSKCGDSEAMELLVKHYQPRLAGFVLVCVGDGQAVDDLCQTIFLKVLARLRCLKQDERFEAWLFRIARNACCDHLRRRRVRRLFVPWQTDADQFAIMAESGDNYRIDAFRRALMMLPKKQRELIALLQDSQLSYEQLAVITNSSVSSVKSRLFRARSFLRKRMRDDG